MKKVLVLISILFLVSVSLLFVSCQSNPVENEFDGVSFSNVSVVYDGNVHKVEITGSLPDGATVTYQNNEGINAGVYNATATVQKEGYKTIVLKATLTISKATFSGITLESDTVFYDGEKHSLQIVGDLPSGTVVTYQNNNQSERGEYEVIATITNENYESLVLSATLRIRTLADAAGIINSLLQRPDVWGFLPEAFSVSKMGYDALPCSDFSSPVQVNLIGTKFIGKQMKVVYDTLNNTQSVLQAVDFVFMAGEAISGVYQMFINNNPDEYSEFVGNVEIAGVSFSLKVSVDDTVSTLLLGNNTVNVMLSVDNLQHINEARIQITNGLILRYVSSENYLRMAVKGEVSAVEIAQDIEFVRDTETNAVAGYLYEYYGVASKAIKTTALLTSNQNYTYIVGNKRESDDLFIDAYQEVYDSQTGKYIGAEVAETVKAVDFDTLWFNLYDISGIDSVQITDESNGLNADTVYLNGQSTPLETKNIGGIGLDTFSRRYDVEMKEVWYVVCKQDDSGKLQYVTEKTLIPMLFVQNKCLENFSEDICNANEYLGTVRLPDWSLITDNFKSTSETYTLLKEEKTIQEIDDFIGEANIFFQ